MILNTQEFITQAMSLIYAGFTQEEVSKRLSTTPENFCHRLKRTTGLTYTKIRRTFLRQDVALEEATQSALKLIIGPKKRKRGPAKVIEKIAQPVDWRATFAAAALPGLITVHGNRWDVEREKQAICKLAFEWADAMVYAQSLRGE